MLAVLHRLFDNGKESVGRLQIILGEFDQFSCYTIERAYHGNKPFKSSIPAGKYELVWSDSPKYGRVLSVVGGKVSLTPSPSYERFAIRVHAANLASQLEGCIAPGDSVDVIKGRIAVTNSRSTLRELEAAVGENDHVPLHIYAPQGVSV